MHYRWHPLYGRDLIVHFRVDWRSGVAFRCQVGEDDVRDRRDIPAWMFDGAACSQMQLVSEPYVSLEALRELRHLLDSAGRGRECQDRSRFKPGGSDDTEETAGEQAAPAGAFRSVPASAEMGLAGTGRSEERDEVGGPDDAGAPGQARGTSPGGHRS